MEVEVANILSRFISQDILKHIVNPYHIPYEVVKNHSRVLKDIIKFKLYCEGSSSAMAERGIDYHLYGLPKVRYYDRQCGYDPRLDPDSCITLGEFTIGITEIENRRYNLEGNFDLKSRYAYSFAKKKWIHFKKTSPMYHPNTPFANACFDYLSRLEQS